MALKELLKKVFKSDKSRSSVRASSSPEITKTNEVEDKKKWRFSKDPNTMNGNNKPSTVEVIVPDNKEKKKKKKKISRKTTEENLNQEEEASVEKEIARLSINSHIEDDKDELDDGEEHENEKSEDIEMLGLGEDDHDEDKEFECLSPEQIIAEQERAVKTIADLFHVSPSGASAMLRHFQWQKEKLIQKFFENPEQVRKEVGVIIEDEQINNSAASKQPVEGFSCSICCDVIPDDETATLSCKHTFCNNCWNQHLTYRINEGEASHLHCPSMNCNVIVDEAFVKRHVPAETFSKYLSFITKSFVENSEGRVKWCPQPNCGNAITSEMIKGKIVKCSCGYRFCFSCHKEAHAPASCEQVKDWELKCKDDSETQHWKIANTKDCPKCNASVEKNGGCNHMVCRQCKHEWCWVCSRAWKGHNDYYNCNKFVASTATPEAASQKRKSFSIFNRNKKTKEELIREKEMEREKNRLALERYLHYYERYANHAHSLNLEKQIINAAMKKVTELKEEAVSSSDVNYIMEGTEVLLECRSCLKYSYVFSYFLPEQGPKKALFELLQEDLEKTTESLSELLETAGKDPSVRLKALNLIQLAKTRKNNMIQAVEQGLTEYHLPTTTTTTTKVGME